VGEGYDRTVTVRLPDKLVSGNYYLTPWVDPYATLLEDTLAVNVNLDDPAELNSNNYKAGGAAIPGRPNVLQIIGNPPPLVNPELAVAINHVTPSALAGVDGENHFEVTYTLTNSGTGAASGYPVQLLLSTAPLANAPGAERFTLASGTGPNIGPNIGPGQSVTLTQTFLLPPGLHGSYVIVTANVSGDTNPDDNSAFAITSVDAPLPDLRVVEVVPPVGALSGEMVEISYTVLNDSDTAVWGGTEFWEDQIWISRDPTFIQSRAIHVATLNISNQTPLAGGASYSRTVEANLPPGIEGDYYVYVFTNTRLGLLDHQRPGPFNSLSLQQGRHLRAAFEANDGSVLSALTPVEYREPDLQVTDLQVPTGLLAGQTVDITFTVTNVGNRDTREDRWTDRVYLSLDATLDEGDFLLRREVDGREVMAEFVRDGVLAAGESYTATVTVTLPFEVSGAFHVLAAPCGRSGRPDRQCARVPGRGQQHHLRRCHHQPCGGPEPCGQRPHHAGAGGARPGLRDHLHGDQEAVAETEGGAAHMERSRANPDAAGIVRGIQKLNGRRRYHPSPG
jgi:large repetitive protein